MYDILSHVKKCKNCGALIELREKVCKYCNHVYEPISLTPEEQAASYIQVCDDINNAFFRLEGFMYGNSTNYQSFNFDRAFSVLFFKTREAINYTPKNFKLISKYWELTQQITYDHDKSNYSNHEINDNEDFINDINVLSHLNNERIHEFNEFTLPEEWEEKRLSILDIKKDFFESRHIENQSQPKQISKRSKSKKKSKVKEVKNEFTKLINDIEIVFKYNYPALEKPLVFYHNAKECVRKFKYVTPIKFKNFSKTESILALKHFDFVINELLDNAQTDFATISRWLVKYKIQYHEIFFNHKKNELIDFLNDKLPSLSFSLSDEYNKDQEHIQYDFFNYWYGFFLLEASTFVKELNEVINNSSPNLGFKSLIINDDTMAVAEVNFEISIPKIPEFPKISISNENSKIESKKPLKKVKNEIVPSKATKQFDTKSPISQFEKISSLDDEFNSAMSQFESASKKFNNNLNSTFQLKEKPSNNEQALSFKDVFIVDNWLDFIGVLGKIEPPLIDGSLNYIGPKRGKKALICNWIQTLQKKGKIKTSVNRQLLSQVLNNEIKGLNLGKDGSTFSKYNKEYLVDWEDKLLKIAGLLP